MKESERKWFLSLPEEMKLTLLGDMLKEGNAVGALETAKILLDAPIHEGGISTGKITKVFDDNRNEKTKQR